MLYRRTVAFHTAFAIAVENHSALTFEGAGCLSVLRTWCLIVLSIKFVSSPFRLCTVLVVLLPVIRLTMWDCLFSEVGDAALGKKGNGWVGVEVRLAFIRLKLEKGKKDEKWLSAALVTWNPFSLCSVLACNEACMVLEELDVPKKKTDAQSEEILPIEKLIAEAYSAIGKVGKVGTLQTREHKENQGLQEEGRQWRSTMAGIVLMLLQ
ncbi:hypothetical protein Ancab_023975 [Ancistrocladus abbreviatus]